jgi:hypothetical protein
LPVKAKNLWLQTRQRNTFDHVARFFVDLVQKVIGGENTPENDPEDLHHYGLGVAIEVKGADNNHHHRLGVEEFASDISRTLTFPLERIFYAFGCYMNRNPQRTYSESSKTFTRRSLLVHSKNENEARLVLVQKTDSLYVIDSRVLEAMIHYLKVKTEKLGKMRDERVYKILRKHLRPWTARNAYKMLVRLHLDPNEWAVSERLVSVRMTAGFEHDVILKIITVVPSEYHERLGRAIRKRTTILSTRTSLQLNLF